MRPFSCFSSLSPGFFSSLFSFFQCIPAKNSPEVFVFDHLPAKRPICFGLVFGSHFLHPPAEWDYIPGPLFGLEMSSFCQVYSILSGWQVTPGFKNSHFSDLQVFLSDWRQQQIPRVNHTASSLILSLQRPLLTSLFWDLNLLFLFISFSTKKTKLMETRNISGVIASVEKL